MVEMRLIDKVIFLLGVGDVNNKRHSENDQ